MLHSSVFSFAKGQNKGKSIDTYSQKNKTAREDPNGLFFTKIFLIELNYKDFL